MVAKRLRPDMYDPNYVTKHTILELRCPDYKVETIERFIVYAESLFIELDDLPTEEYLFKWMYDNFNAWNPVRFSKSMLRIFMALG